MSDGCEAMAGRVLAKIFLEALGRINMRFVRTLENEILEIFEKSVDGGSKILKIRSR